MKNHWATPQPLMHAFRQAFATSTEWFASPLNHSPHIPQYASAYAKDTEFGAIHNAYGHKWTGSGQVNPEYVDTDMHAAMRWAIASTYDTEPAFNVMVLPDYSDKYGFEGFIKHPHVHRLCQIPAKQLSFDHPYHWNGRGFQAGKAKFAVRILVVANQAGMDAYYDVGRLHHITQALQHLGVQGYTMYPAMNLPTSSPPFRKPPAFSRAQGHPEAPPWVSNCSESLPAATLQACFACYCAEKELRFDSNALVYTDGSKSKTSVTAAVYFAARQTVRMMRVAGHPGQLNTALRGELAGIHEALHHTARDLPITLLTDSLTSIHLINATMYRCESQKTHKHRHIINQIVQRLATRTAATTVYKVRAHIGVMGNTKADAAAEQAHNPELPGVTRFGAASEAGRPAHWVKHPVMVRDENGDREEWQDVDTL